MPELVGAQLPSSGSGPLDDVGETHTFGEEDVVLVTARVLSQQSDPTQPADEEPAQSPLVVVAGLHAHARRVDAYADGTEPRAQEVFKGLPRKTHPLLDDAMVRHRAIVRRPLPSSAGLGSGRADPNRGDRRAAARDAGVCPCPAALPRRRARNSSRQSAGLVEEQHSDRALWPSPIASVRGARANTLVSCDATDCWWSRAVAPTACL